MAPLAAPSSSSSRGLVPACSTLGGCSRSLAILGGGASGLIALRTALLSKRYQRVVLFEKTGDVGGLWNPDRDDSPVYRDLRTNLPGAVMSVPGLAYASDKSFGRHEAVLRHLRELYEKVQGMMEGCCLGASAPTTLGASQGGAGVEFGGAAVDVDVRLQTEVVWVEPRRDGALDANNHAASEEEEAVSEIPATFGVTSRDVRTGAKTEELFEAILIGNGHFDRPFVPEPFRKFFADFRRQPAPALSDGEQPSTVPETSAGLNDDRTRVLHACVFDDPTLFAGANVIVVGAGPSGSDIVELLRPHARSLHWVHRNLVTNPAFQKHLTDGDNYTEDGDNNSDSVDKRRGAPPVRRMGRISLSFLPPPNNPQKLPDEIQVELSADPGLARTYSCRAREEEDAAAAPPPPQASITHLIQGLSRTNTYIIFATGYAFEFPFLDTSLCPGEADALGLPYQLPISQNLDDALFGRGRLRNMGFLGIPKKGGPFPIIWAQCLAFFYKRADFHGRAEGRGLPDFRFDPNVDMWDYMRHLLLKYVGLGQGARAGSDCNQGSTSDLLAGLAHTGLAQESALLEKALQSETAAAPGPATVELLQQEGPTAADLLVGGVPNRCCWSQPMLISPRMVRAVVAKTGSLQSVDELFAVLEGGEDGDHAGAEEVEVQRSGGGDRDTAWEEDALLGRIFHEIRLREEMAIVNGAIRRLTSRYRDVEFRRCVKPSGEKPSWTLQLSW